MLFAGTKLYERGKRNEAVWNFIGRNSRAARQLQDDLDAQIASARLGAKRFAELMDRYGRQMVLDATQQLMDYTERVLRQRIAAIPDGEYRAEGFLDDDGKNRDVRLPIKVCVRVKGDDIEIDLTGSSKQVETAFNVPFEGSTKVACFCAVRSLLLDAVTSDVKVPSNQGSFRPVKVTAPKGSIYNPIYPAAAEARFAQINRVIDLIYKALAPVLPNDIIAGSSASLSFCSYAGIRPSGDYWVFLEVNEGSYGGRPRSDGPDCIDSLMANTRNNPIEDLAMHLPMICDRYELRDDVMPGAGRFRGGIGVVKAQRVLTDAFITHENERHFDVPWGIFGGDPGQVGKVDIYNVARLDDVKHMPAKFSGMRVAAGDVHVFYAPCGGGYGDPLERPAAKVLDDVLDGFCTVEHARAAYGVIVDLTAETVDEAATKALRERMRAAPRAKAETSAVALRRRPAPAPAPRSRATPTPSMPAGQRLKTSGAAAEPGRAASPARRALGREQQWRFAGRSLARIARRLRQRLEFRNRQAQHQWRHHRGDRPIACQWRDGARDRSRRRAARRFARRVVAANCQRQPLQVRRDADAQWTLECSGFSGKVGSSLEQRATIFVEVMIVIAVIGVLAFLIGLIVRLPQRQQAAANGKGQAEPSPRWYEFTLALILLAAIAAFAIWLISSGTHWVWGETIEDWRSDDRTITFAAVMVALAVVGLVVSLVYALVQSSHGTAAPGAVARRPAETAADAAAADAAQAPPAPSPLRVLGLLVLVVAILLLCWIALAPAAQYGLIGATDLSREPRRDAGAAVRQGDADLGRQAAAPSQCANGCCATCWHFC